MQIESYDVETITDRHDKKLPIDVTTTQPTKKDLYINDPPPPIIDNNLSFPVTNTKRRVGRPRKNVSTVQNSSQSVADSVKRRHSSNIQQDQTSEQNNRASKPTSKDDDESTEDEVLSDIPGIKSQRTNDNRKTTGLSSDEDNRESNVIDQDSNISSNKKKHGRNCFKLLNKRNSNVVVEEDANNHVDKRRKGRPTAHLKYKISGESV